MDGLVPACVAISNKCSRVLQSRRKIMNQAFLYVAMRQILAALLALAIPMCFDVPGAHGQQPKEAERVHFLLAIDTRDKIAKALGLDLDRDNMKKIIGDSMQACGYQEGPKGKYTITVLDATLMSEKTVLDHYRKLKVGDNETLVFYFTGHGGFYPEKGHLLAMRNFYNF